MNQGQLQLAALTDAVLALYGEPGPTCDTGLGALSDLLHDLAAQRREER